MSKKHDEYMSRKYQGMSHQEVYNSKLGTLQDALNLIESGDSICFSTHGSEPKVFFENLHTIADRIDPNNPVQMWTAVHRYKYECVTSKDPEIIARFHMNTFFYDGWMRESHPRKFNTYFPVFLHNYGEEMMKTSIAPNVCVFQVSPMDEHGYCCLFGDLQHTLEALEEAEKVIFEVNARAPRVFGEGSIPVTMADAIYETDYQIFQLADPAMGEAEKAVAGYCSEMVRDGDCIQLGFGGIPNAIGASLTNRLDLSIHTEQIGSSMAKLMDMGVITNRNKNLDKGLTVGTFVIGDDFLYHFINNHPRIQVRKGRYTNDPFIIAQQDNMVSINAALQIDLTGQICAESIGSQQYSGTGGATDFSYGAYHSKGGRAMVAQVSTTMKGTMSRIQPTLQPGSVVSVSRNLTDMVVTEFGIAKLRQKTVKERVEELIAVAHPDFRAELRKEAEKHMYY